MYMKFLNSLKHHSKFNQKKTGIKSAQYPKVLTINRPGDEICTITSICMIEN